MVLQIRAKTMLVYLDKLLYSFVRRNFSDMEQIELGSRKYGHSNFLEKLVRNIDASINISTIFSYLSKPIGTAFFSIAYIQHTSVL